MPPVPPPPRFARWTALLALALPILAGLAYMALFAAPVEYLLLNGVALALGFAWLRFGQLPKKASARRVLALLLLLILVLPLITGPEISDVTRWLPLGPFVLHSGMLAIPPLVVLAASEREDAPLLLLTALFAALIQPDAASAFAVTFAAVGLHHVSQDWRIGLVSVAAFFTAIVAALRGELPAEPFVERVLVEAAFAMPAMGLALFAALISGFLLILFAVPLPRPARFALGGSLFGFGISSIMSNYPSPLIGFGVAPILGYALALSDRPPRPEPAP